MAADDGSDDRRRAELTRTPAQDTIFALSSGRPPAAIAVIRISGPAAPDALRTLAGNLASPRRMVVRSLHDAAGGLLDRALVTWFPGPRTVTGEDVAELQVHGGRAVVAAVLAALAALPGLRAAEPGEFTRRALLGGHIDLAEAEGLADLLEAETEGQRRNALRLVEGGLGRLVEHWRVSLLDLAAACEAAIDHEEEAGLAAFGGTERGRLAALACELAARLAAPSAERLRDGIRIVIAGPVNAGKSSLLNALAGREAAIASPVEGTTRDLVEAPLAIDGIPCVLVDSAGLRETVDPVESIGVSRARSAMDAADIILWLGGPPGLLDPRIIWVRSKADLADGSTAPSPADISVSVLREESVAALRSMLVRRMTALLPVAGELALNQRHRGELGYMVTNLEEAAAEPDIILVAEHLRAALEAIDRMIGRAGPEDMLDVLFSRFCLGK